MAKLSKDEFRRQVREMLHPELQTMQQPQAPPLPKTLSFLRRPKVAVPEPTPTESTATVPKRRRFPFIGMGK